MLEAVYTAGAKNEEKTKAQMRQTLKANLAKNLKKNAEAIGKQNRRIMSMAVKDKAGWKESSDMAAAKSTDVGSLM